MKNNKGVSLAELSMVLAVIGLLLAAIVGGLGIRKSAELRSFMSDIDGFKIAIASFESKYGVAPGDMPDAYTYWTTDCANSGVPATDAARCNGNGDGAINMSFTDGLDSEIYRAWQHLVLSEFLTGNYTGTATVSNIQSDIGINVPASRRAKVGYHIEDNGNSVRYIFLAAFQSGGLNLNAALTPQEMLAIDSKMDDGMPMTGIVKGYTGNDAFSAGTPCYTGITSTDTYLITTTTNVCAGYFYF